MNNKKIYIITLCLCFLLAGCLTTINTASATKDWKHCSDIDPTHKSPIFIQTSQFTDHRTETPCIRVSYEKRNEYDTSDYRVFMLCKHKNGYMEEQVFDLIGRGPVMTPYTLFALNPDDGNGDDVDISVTYQIIKKPT